MGEVLGTKDMDFSLQEEEEEEQELKKDPMMRWEIFLPRTSLRVLLVEADDCTRQIIAALLRKCNYKVAAFADGLRAWETLERFHNIDLVLTEVELPSISGFSLLNMIMGHETCKNIPVIMMSSHDSISMVFKCMLKGAADFLVKPIRKNELRNLWQHVWRRHSSSGGRPAGQDANPSQRKFNAISENNAASNPTNDYADCMQKNRECSEKGSDAQSSCTKPDMEAESSCRHNLHDILQPQCWSACLAIDTDVQRCKELIKFDGTLLTQETLAECKSSRSESELTPCNQEIGSNVKIISEKHVAPASYREDANFISEPKDYSDKQAGPSREAIDLIGAIDYKPQWSYKIADQSSVRGDVLNDGENPSNAKNRAYNLSSSPLLELSLRRSQPNGCENQEMEGRHTLNHSNASAFSRYNNRTVQPIFQSSTGFSTERRECTSGSHQYLSKQGPDDANDAPKCNEVTHNSHKDMDSLAGCPPNQDKTISPCPPVGIVPVPVHIGGMSFDGLCPGYSLLPPLFYAQPDPLLWSANGTSQQEEIHANSSHQSKTKAKNSEQNDHPHEQTSSNPICQYETRLEHRYESNEDPVNVPSATGHSEMSSLCNGSKSHLNSSGCASFWNGATAESGNRESLLPQDGIRVVDYQRSSQREAALNKFRLKRKDRCYEKKVLYQSRKRLAEQRPRVKGQFVRQVQLDPHSTAVETDCYHCDSFAA